MTDAYPIGCGALALQWETSCSSAETRTMACAHERWQIRPDAQEKQQESAVTVGKQGGRRTKFILLRLYYCFSWFRVSTVGKHRRTYYSMDCRAAKLWALARPPGFRAPLTRPSFTKFTPYIFYVVPKRLWG